MGDDESMKQEMEREMTEKTPMEAVKDDLLGEDSGEPTPEESEELRERVDEKRG